MLFRPDSTHGTGMPLWPLLHFVQLAIAALPWCLARHSSALLLQMQTVHGPSDSLMSQVPESHPA